MEFKFNNVTIRLTWKSYAYIIAACIIFLVGLILPQLPSSKKMYRERFNSFYNSNLIGEIESYGYGRPISIRLKGADKYYFFYLRFGLNTKYPFSSIVALGDSVVKPAKSDTLTIIKPTGEKYYFSFDQSWEDE